MGVITIKYMKRVRGFVYLLCALFLLWPVSAKAVAVPSDVFITELQTSSATASGEEFVEIYNNTDSDINLADPVNSWKIQYFSSTKVTQTGFSWDATSPSGSISLTGTVAAHDYYLLSSSNGGVAYTPGSNDPDQSYSSSHFADTAGGVRLVSVNGTTVSEHDHIGWSNGIPLLPGLMVTPPAGGSLQRPVDSQGSYTDSQNLLLPFVPMNGITPKAMWQQPAHDDESDNPAPDSSTTDQDQIDNPTDVSNNQITSATPTTLQITELLPNPASPATDTNDEFVEIYNYGDEPIDLHGFTIQTGSNYSYSYTIPDETLEPHSYKTFTSGDTPLTLANSGGRARLLDPAGITLSETTAYSDAPEGEAWALFNDIWQWTTTPTPAAANVFGLPPTDTAKTTAKKTTAKTTKPTAKKSTAKSSKTGLVGGAQSSQGSGVTDQVPALHPNILAGIGAAALLYGAYEYRQDIANRLYQLRKYRATRRATRTGAKGA